MQFYTLLAFGKSKNANFPKWTLFVFVYTGWTNFSQVNLPIYGRNARYIVLRANSFGQKPIPNFPGKHGGILPFIVGDGIHHRWGGNFRLWTANHTRLKTASLIIPGSIEKVPSITYLRIQFLNMLTEKKFKFWTPCIVSLVGILLGSG